MVNIRCTQKLLRRLPVAADPAASTTVLGDWYVNILFSRPQQLVLCVSERSLLPVVLPAKEASTLAFRLAVAAGEILQRLGIAPTLVERELAEMHNFAYGPTRNRRVLGTVNDFMFMLSWRLQDWSGQSLLEHSLHLAQSPCKPIGYGSPDVVTVALFQSARAHPNAFH